MRSYGPDGAPPATQTGNAATNCEMRTRSEESVRELGKQFQTRGGTPKYHKEVPFANRRLRWATDEHSPGAPQTNKSKAGKESRMIGSPCPSKRRIMTV